MTPYYSDDSAGNRIAALEAALFKCRDLIGTDATARLVVEQQPLGYYRELINAALAGHDSPSVVQFVPEAMDSLDKGRRA